MVAQNPIVLSPQFTQTPLAGGSPIAETPKRLVSLDALRGFDMFWIIGGCGLILAIAEFTGNSSFIATVKHHIEHVGWNGFAAIDLVFPLFVFISGVSMPFSLTAKLERGEAKWRLYRRLVRRAILLVGLGLLGGFLTFDFANMRPLSVLGLIGMANLIAGVVVINRGPRGQAAWAAGILLGYWAAVALIPVPGVGAGVITPGGCLNAFIDYNLLPGKLYQGVFDPEGILAWLPAAAMALIGAQAGNLLRNNPLKQGVNAYRNVLILAAAGCVFLGVGFLWGMSFPIIKAIWSSSFVTFAAGWSLLLLALFYLVIDVWQARWLGFVFIPIGMNAITIYVGSSFINFSYTAEQLFGGLARISPPEFTPIIASCGVLAVEWLFLYFLYRKKIFLRV